MNLWTAIERHETRNRRRPLPHREPRPGRTRLTIVLAAIALLFGPVLLASVDAGIFQRLREHRQQRAAGSVNVCNPAACAPAACSACASCQGLLDNCRETASHNVRTLRWRPFQRFRRRFDRDVDPMPQPDVDPCPPPDPSPVPPIPPPPIKTDPPPAPASGYHFLAIVDPNWYATATPKQAAIFTDPALRTYLDGTFPGSYKIYISTEPTATMPAPFRDYFAASLAEKHPLPWIWLFDPSKKEVLTEALPADAKATLADVQKARAAK